MAIDTDRDVVITFTETIERTLELDFSRMAKALGISKKALADILDEGEEYEPDDKAKARLRLLADIASEEFDVEEVAEA